MPKPRLFMSHALAACLVLLTTDCGDRPPAGGLTAVDSAGVRILTSGGAGWEERDAWRLELDLDIGSPGGSDAFGRLIDVAPRRVGGLWAVDGQARRVRGFDEQGREVLSFGRRGEGPGEFRSIGRLAERPDGSFRVGGRMPVELYAFDASGRSLGTTQVSPDIYRPATASDDPEALPLGPTLAGWQFTPDGTSFVQTTTLDATGGDVVRRDALVRLDKEGTGPTRLASWQAPAMRGGAGGQLLLLQPAASWSPLGDGGTWLTFGETYEIRRYDGGGALRSILRRPQARVELSPDVIERFKGGLAEEAETPAMLAMLDNALLPDSLPATAALWASEDGRLWVGVMDPARPLRLEEPNALDVFGDDGAYLGRLAIPDRLRPTRITAQHVYGVWRDDLDVSHARRYRIVRRE